MKACNIAICISMFFINLTMAKNALPIIVDINKVSPELRDWMKNNPPTVKPEHLELIVATDKHHYLSGEPVTLTVAVRNTTDKEIELDYPEGPFGATFIVVHKPSVSGKTAGIGEKKHDESSTKARERGPSYDGPGDRYKIASKGALSFSCILSNWYDLTSPSGKYTVNIHHRVEQNLQFVFTMNATLAFEILPRAADINSIAAEDMATVFGRKKAMELLGGEAESILARMEEGNVEDIAKSPEYGRLMMILRTLDEGSSHLSPDRRLKFLEENGRMSVKELRGFVRICRGNEKQ